MKASELIKQLQDLVEEFGDLPVNYAAPYDDVTVNAVRVYDETGNHPGNPNKAVEIFLHG